ncbi:class I SAM-dependent methyltransferase [Streptococcus anginosus]|jgi:methyltransferase domain protein|uniref:Class I SAM-dependent methyltransferase n=1 Tax=Parvimonas micra TaxID=33033 RepID=A0AAX3K622_9FIRM|nr:class I SAM-dependent methyltransferase [Parvimonas micra]MBF1275471.1 class I SAM-dependent methyltransferase [Parvimonas micra]MCY7227608.1 class I SAM-dependent methyltransferase [Streptococcus anginosus]WBB30613.1 class I SAM-dependent methyltransferase [Parvimonas micra]HEU4280297.1 class I SAM-dependent methyltransferase [Streptococcus pneumoniae]
MNDKSNKEFWDKFAKLYALFMRKDQGVYNQVCRYIYPYLNRGMNVLELACGSGQLK